MAAGTSGASNESCLKHNPFIVDTHFLVPLENILL